MQNNSGVLCPHPLTTKFQITPMNIDLASGIAAHFGGKITSPVYSAKL
jgi:hypothetical protein